MDEPTTTPTTEPVTDEPVIEAAPRVLDSGMLLEAVDNEGWNWRVMLVRAGRSLNNNHYPLEVLHEAAPAYSGVPVYFGKGPDHSPNERGFASVAGYITSAKPNPNGIEGVLEVNRGKPDVRDALRHAFQVKLRTGKETVGLSHVVPHGGAVLEALKPHGYRVRAIKHVSSVDLVMSPSAGGGLISSLAESFVPDPLQEAIVGNEQLLARLRAGDKLGPDDMTRLIESLGGADVADAIEAAKPKPVDPAPLTEAVTPSAAETRLTEAAAAYERRIALADSRILLTEKLAESKLPAELTEAIRADFADTVIDESVLDARVARDRDIAAKLMSVKPHGLGSTVVITEDQREKHQKAMDGLFENRDIDGVPRFKTLRQAYPIISGDQRYEYFSAELPRRILAEAIAFAGDDQIIQESITSSTFGDILGDTIRRRMLAEFARPDRQSWRAISTTETVMDFRTVERERMGGYGFLPLVNEGGTYQNLTSPGDEKVTDALDKRGGLEELTLETIANDDMGVVRRIPTKLGFAAVDTLYNTVWNTTILDNATYSADSLALFHATHANTGTTALGEAGLLAVENAMRDQTEFGNATALPLGEANMPRVLAIPNELRITAHKLLMGPNASVSAETATTPNMFYNAGYQLIVVDSWTDANNWYAFADASRQPTLEVGFYQGREEPELFVQDAQNVGSMFTADKVTYKIRHIWYVMVLDYRSAYRQVVT